MSSTDTPDLYGLKSWLKKKGTNQGLWHKRFVTLNEKKIVISKDEEQTHIEQVIDLGPDTTAEIVTGASTPRFQVIPSAGADPLLFTAGSPEEVARWVAAINQIKLPMQHLTMDNFRIISVIGRGFYGKVMLVQKLDTGDLYAIKSIHKSRINEPGKANSVLAERNIMMRAHYPFLVNLCFAFQTPAKFYLGLEYAAGGELFYHMDKVGTIPLNDARLYIAEIGLALSYLHSLGIVYRDLKPENILFDAEGHIKLTDFGLSKSLIDSESTSTFCGTSEYLAPEVIMQQTYSYAIDEWALGVLAFEMILGVTPFYDDNKAVMFGKIVNEPPVFPQGLDNRIIDFINKLLAKDPAQRAKFDDLKSHPFFEGFDWVKVYNRDYTPSFVPQVKDPLNTQNFDPEFTSEIAADSFVQPAIGDDGAVQGFSYYDSNMN
ncbi:AGC family protein kinase [Trichomonas vaginalis G3]|uniref:non-specific serine/threonine protein kinase n=1 Tax=Trichomonas vaginalis (strain ATCC PRA-98 / G3) TaxID=412133 RepID=A2EED1_TRIV3|nr:protein serine/threonine kinase protein [Trichomonas vaginalis G3]EAY08937.1 AGC family protein kinase [Trichomonas vaginalis G3]KAI5508614.1 protein serine/threonine kinase protein [Trichomonas vaginalis G3]|eukprot:XP_001321160.1 AGC family protein kinase [Trichomonas vaginalis G3]